jgi:hypothetical protein
VWQGYTYLTDAAVSSVHTAKPIDALGLDLALFATTVATPSGDVTVFAVVRGYKPKPRRTVLTGYQALRCGCSSNCGCGEQAHRHRAEAETFHGENGSGGKRSWGSEDNV